MTFKEILIWFMKRLAAVPSPVPAPINTPVPPSVVAETKVMLILPGVRSTGAHTDPNGLLDREAAVGYAELKGYVGYVLNVSGETGPQSPQTMSALKVIRNHENNIRAIYGFSGGAYNARHIWRALSQQDRDRIELIVVVGAGPVRPVDLLPLKNVVIFGDPPEGHMQGPKKLLELAQWAQEPNESTF